MDGKTRRFNPSTGTSMQRVFELTDTVNSDSSKYSPTIDSMLE